MIKSQPDQHYDYEGTTVELVSKELNHLVAILHVYAGVWILWSKKKKLLFFKKKMEILLHPKVIKLLEH